MKSPDLILLSHQPEQAGARAALADLAAKMGLVSVGVSPPTHLLSLTWASQGENPAFTVLLRADDSAVLLVREAAGRNEVAANAALQVLSAFRLSVEGYSVSLEFQMPGYPVSPVALTGLYPDAAQMEALLANPAFVRWLKQMKFRFVDPDL